jgi:hypothetical protein
MTPAMSASDYDFLMGYAAGFVVGVFAALWAARDKR